MRRVFDLFPFFDELNCLDIRLHELDPVVDCFIICEAGETYGGSPREYVFAKNRERFEEFRHKIMYVRLPALFPPCKDRDSGRRRERYQRDEMMPALLRCNPKPEDVILFSDCDEIPRASAVQYALDTPGILGSGIHRFKQRSYYYNVNRQVDYGNDFASRARIGTFADLKALGSLYDFRMARKDTKEFALEEGGWHFSYFGDLAKINRKVAALSPFLAEYKLFGDEQLKKDIIAGKDLHHRKCEMPDVFAQTPSNDPMLPDYFLQHRDGKFKVLTLEGQF